MRLSVLRSNRSGQARRRGRPGPGRGQSGQTRFDRGSKVEAAKRGSTAGEGRRGQARRGGRRARFDRGQTRSSMAMQREAAKAAKQAANSVHKQKWCGAAAIGAVSAPGGAQPIRPFDFFSPVVFVCFRLKGFGIEVVKPHRPDGVGPAKRREAEPV